MIRLTEPIIDITMKVDFNLPQTQILEFLNKKGYEIKAYRLHLPATEELLVSEPPLVQHTFTATKEGEKPSESNLYLKVFEKEIKSLLNQL